MNETTKSDNETAELIELVYRPLRTEPDIFGDVETESYRLDLIGRCVERIRRDARDVAEAARLDVAEAARLAEADHPKHSIGWRAKD